MNSRPAFHLFAHCLLTSPIGTLVWLNDPKDFVIRLCNGRRVGHKDSSFPLTPPRNYDSRLHRGGRGGAGFRQRLFVSPWRGGCWFQTKIAGQPLALFLKLANEGQTCQRRRFAHAAQDWARSELLDLLRRLRREPGACWRVVLEHWACLLFEAPGALFGVENGGRPFLGVASIKPEATLSFEGFSMTQIHFSGS